MRFPPSVQARTTPDQASAVMPPSKSDFDEIIGQIAANDPNLTEVANHNKKGRGDDRAVRIAEALRMNTHVTSIDLIFNNIGVAGATALAGILSKNSALTALDLFDNNIGDVGAAAFEDALRNN
mmetsp:Transcript_4107/g.11304  ORF Transcript_4107/g.11304 Transcript_4107/m.11304 type:complete len:124 (+) Transcript_4107:186-557(+)